MLTPSLYRQSLQNVEPGVRLLVESPEPGDLACVLVTVVDVLGRGLFRVRGIDGAEWVCPSECILRRE